MTNLPRIRTPFVQHIRRIRYQLLPVLTFLAAGCLTIWLWRQHSGMPNAVGMVEVVQFEMTAPADGVLVGVANGPWQPFQQVGPGVMVARLDSAPVDAAREIVQREVTRLKKDLAATEAQVRQEIADAMMDQANHQRRRRAEVRMLALDVERLRLDVLDRTTLIEADRVEFRRYNERYEATKKARDKGVATPYELTDVQLKRDVVGGRIGAAEKGLRQAREQLSTVQARKAEAVKELSDFAATSQPASRDIQTFLAPIQAAVAVQEARMREVQVQMESLEVRAPTDAPEGERGMTISEIWRRPGQFVRAGDPIITLAVPQSRFVVSYVRETQGFRPKVDMPVTVRIRSVPVRIVNGRVKGVGPQVAGVPRHQLRDPQYREWGLPVRIQVDEDLDLPPGELVDITFVLAR